MADRYFCMGQVFLANGTGVITEAGRLVADATLNVTTEGTFTFTMANGTTCVITSGTSVVTNSPVTLSAGANAITCTGAGTIDFNITIGTAATTNSVNSWSATSGGAVTASVPTSADNVYFNANSFTAGSQVLTVNAAVSCLDMDWTGTTNNPTLALTTNSIYYYGNVVFILAMFFTASGGASFRAYSTGAQSLRTNGLTLGSIFTGIETSGCILTLLDTLSVVGTFFTKNGTTLLTGNNAISCTIFDQSNAGTRTVTLGASTINCTAWDYTGSDLILTANTATINVSGTGAFAGGGITTYNDVNFSGSSHTLSGVNTFHNIGFSGSDCTLTLSNNQTANIVTIDRSVSNKTIVGAVNLTVNDLIILVSGTRTVTITNTDFVKTGGRVVSDYLVLSGSAASGGASFYAGANSTDSGSNTGWLFRNCPYWMGK